MEQEIFKDTKVNFNKLIEFGFDEANGALHILRPSWRKPIFT